MPPATYTAFTPTNVTPSTTPPTAFTPSGVTPSAAAPLPFFPVQRRFVSTDDMIAQDTVLVTPGASEQVIVGTGVAESAWKIFTLTAGAHAGDSTHIRPTDYNASTNAKHWLQTATGNYPA
jgi:hypothetical protein